MSGEPANFNARAMARWLAKRGQTPRARRQQPGPRPTLGDLQHATPWVGSTAKRASTTRRWRALSL